MSLDEAKDATDSVQEVAGFTFVYGDKVKQHVEYAVIDYKNSILGEGFSISNKNSTDCC